MTALARFVPRRDAVVAWVSENPQRRSLARVAAWIAVTRLTMAAVAYTTVRIAMPALHPKARLLLREYPAVASFVRWDAGWYLSITQAGYSDFPSGPSNVAFLPVFPALIKLATQLIGDPAIAGLVVANLAMAAAVIALWDWVRERGGLAAAEGAVQWLLVYPFSFFFHSIYAEAVFFLVCTLALRAADAKRWQAAGFWACVAALTRPLGILLVPAFVWVLVKEWRAGRRPGFDGCAVFLPVIALGLYATHLWLTLGNPLAVWTAHATGWNVRLKWNLFLDWSDALRAMLGRKELYMKLFDALEVVLVVPLIALSLRAWRTVGPAAGLYATLATTVIVVSGHESLGRETLAVVPIFAALSASFNRGWLSAGLKSVLFALLCVFTFAFVTGHFLG